MNTPHYKDLEDQAATMSETRKGWARRWGRIVLVILLSILVAGWLLRKPVAKHVMTQWCDARGFVCQASFQHLDFAGATLSAVFVQADGGQPVQAERVVIGLGWQGISPFVSSVYVDSPLLRGRLKDERVDLYGLERLIPSGGDSGSGRIPAIVVTDGRAVLETEGGQATARFSLTGQFFEHADLDIQIDPVTLDTADGRIELEAGHAQISARQGRLIGETGVSIRDLSLKGVSIRDMHLDALIDAPLETDAATRIRLSGEAGTAVVDSARVDGAKLDAILQMSALPQASVEALVDSFNEVSVDIRGQSAGYAAYSAGAFSLESHLTQDSGLLSGPVRLDLMNVASPIGNLERAEIMGSASRTTNGEVRLDAQLALSGASVSPITRTVLARAVKFPVPLEAHGNALGEALSRAATDFSLDTHVRARAGDAGMDVELSGPAELVSASGMRIELRPLADLPWLVASASGQSLSGALDMNGGGGPRISGTMEGQRTPNGELQLALRDLALEPWSVRERAFEARIKDLRIARSPDETRIQLDGRLGVEGELFGLTVDQTGVVGEVDIVMAGERWSGGPVRGACPRFETGGIVFGAIRTGGFALDLCPRGDTFFASSRVPGGAFNLGRVRVPFESGSATGTLELSETRLSWSAGERPATQLTAGELNMPLAIGDSTLNIVGARPNLQFAAARGAIPSLSGELGQTRFGGSLIPARVSATAFAFDGTSPRGGVKGDIAAREVVIQDIREDPLYQPFLANFAGQLAAGVITGNGVLNLQSTGTPVGDVNFQLTLANLTGETEIHSRDLSFSPSGLRPTHLSERLRGLFTDATGKLSAEASIGIKRGSLSGTGDVRVSDFSFQTTRLGRVEGVNANVHFTDLFALTTAPEQTLTVSSLNPGVLLTDGKMLFQFVDGAMFRVSSAAFPFAGGELALAPFDWGLGGADQHIEVTASLIQLRELVDTLNLPDIEASGTVSGRFPIDVVGNEIFVRDARLMADNQGGHLAYTGQTADAASVADTTSAMAFEALKDFDFTVLELGLDGNIADRMKISLLLAGRSRRGIPYGAEGQTVKGQPFEFDIEINSPFSELFRSSQYYTNQNALTEIVVDRVRASRAKQSE